MSELIPKPRRRMKQPTKDALREKIADQSQELDRLRTQIIHVTRTPWWKRIWRKAA